MRFLSAHPQYADEWCDWWKLDGHDWAALLAAQPQLAGKCDWDVLNGSDHAMNGGDWVRLLDAQPQFADKCNWYLLDEDDRREIIRLRPRFTKVFRMQMKGTLLQSVGGIVYSYRADCVWQDSDYKETDRMTIESAAIVDPSFSGSLVVPDVLGGGRVMGIGEKAFAGWSDLKSVTIPEGVEKIGDSAFADCTHLSRVVFPSSVWDVGSNAFSGTALKTLVFGGLPPEIEWETFPEDAIGYYRPEYAAEWERHICKDGTWEGWCKVEMTSELSKQV